MAEVSTTAMAGDKNRGGAGATQVARPSSEGFFERYKPEQGNRVRVGTFVGLLALAISGAAFLYNRLEVFSGDEVWQILVTVGIPILFLVVFSAVAAWVTFFNRRSGDFMIATDGEMKKVSWSSRREVIGSTKVVIILTLLMAALLFFVDVVLQFAFRWIGMLKV